MGLAPKTNTVIRPFLKFNRRHGDVVTGRQDIFLHSKGDRMTGAKDISLRHVTWTFLELDKRHGHNYRHGQAT